MGKRPSVDLLYRRRCPSDHELDLAQEDRLVYETTAPLGRLSSGYTYHCCIRPAPRERFADSLRTKAQR